MSNVASGLYQLEKLPFTSNEFHAKFTNLVGPLSLFDAEDDPDAGNENPDVERPLTPIEEAVKCMPASFGALAKLLRPRLSPRGYVSELSSSDQQELISILMSELNNIWGDVRNLPPDPFLTSQQNKELQRRLTIELVVIAQGLFAKYLNKAHRLNKQGVFSGPANMSRLKTQLALEANRSFNVLSIRRSLAADMKQPCDTSTVSSHISAGRFHASQATRQYRSLVVRQEEERAKVKEPLTKREKELKHMESELSDLQQQMPTVASRAVVGVFPSGAVRSTRPPSESGSLKSVVEPPAASAKAAKTYFWEKKSMSIPEFPAGENLLVELGIIREQGEERDLTRTYSVDLMKDKDMNEADRPVTPPQPAPGTAAYAAQDLKNLLMTRSDRLVQAESQNDNDEDLPPLLQALAHHSIHTPRKKRVTHEPARRKFEVRGDESEAPGDDDAEGEDDGASVASTLVSTQASSTALDPGTVEETLTEFTGDEHPQPAVVSLRLPDKSVVRTSDVRVSNRVNKNSVTLRRYPTVYNDLTGEIDPPTVQWLDRNLFIGEEIKEVYEEITKTIRTDHLLFDQDGYVEKSAHDVDVTLASASSTLTKPQVERIINPELHQPSLPPWGDGTADGWRNSPKFGGIGREDILQAKLGKAEESGSGQKSYNSWLAWWRSTITTDDYLKFLSTHENDYLSLVFHLYDSEQGSDDEAEGAVRPDTIQMALARAREKKMAELRSLKTSFQPGVWNVNSILMGGLGNDPEVDDEELVSGLETSHRLPGGQSTASILTESDVTMKSKMSTRSARSGAVTRATAAQTLGPSDVSESVAHSRSSEAVPLSPQDRLERVWTLLCVPDALRLDMAIKYSAEPYSSKLDQALASWELATELILERESLMTKLEDFERKASDPNRFFERGFPGSSSDRIRESKTRSWFDKQLSEGEHAIKEIVRQIQHTYGDVVTFQGRAYLEKLSVDRTEMLYWLQQERRQRALHHGADQPKSLHVTALELPRLTPYSLL